MPPPTSNSTETQEPDAEFAAYVRSRCVSREDQEQQKRQEEERRLNLCRQTPVVYHFSSLGINSGTSLFTRFKYRFRVGTFRCEQCKSAPYGPHWAYPHLDPTTVLTSGQLRQLRGRSEKIGWEADVPEAPETRSCIAHLEDTWQVPITSGTRLGPCLVEIDEPPKHDIGTVWLSGCIFARRWAVQSLLNNGLDFDFVEIESTGTFAEEADFVQLVVPIVAHEAIHPEATYCPSCRRVNENKLGWKTKRPDFLYLFPALRRHPFFSTVETGNLFLSPAFVEAASTLGIKGLIDGVTIQPWPVLPDPVGSRPEIVWSRPPKPGPSKRADASTTARIGERRVRRSPQA